MIRRRAFLGGALLVPLVVGSGRAAAQPHLPVSTSDEWDGFDDYVTTLAGEDRFSGAVLASRRGQRLLNAGYNMADRATGEPNTPRTRFCVGSMGKMFTSVAIAQLVERGKLAFDDPIGAHLDEFPAEVASTVTIHHLLTHTAGMGDIFRNEEDHTIAALLAYIVTQPLQFAQGSQFSYSNAGFVTAGAIVERVARQPYTECVRSRPPGT